MSNFVFCLYGSITHAFSQIFPSFFKLFQTLPDVPRVWIAAVRCPQCAYPNDKTFNFCQQCGYRRENFVGAAKRVKINFNAIDARLEALASRKKNKPYEKQKSNLAVEFDNFLFSLPTPKTIMSASPSDITRFRAYKDKDGRTKVHRPACQYFGVTGPPPAIALNDSRQKQ